MNIDPVCGMHVKPESPHRIKRAEKTYRFCGQHCVEKFSADPAAYEGKGSAGRRHGHGACLVGFDI